MSVTEIPHKTPQARSANPLKRLVQSVLLAVLLAPAATLHAGENEEVEAALVELAKTSEAQGFDFRADIWARDLAPDMGKAVRIQLFKGNEYRVCVAVSPKSGVQIEAHVLDSEGKAIESKAEPSSGKWGATLHVKPNRTGVYMVTIRNTGGKQEKALCAMISGFK